MGLHTRTPTSNEPETFDRTGLMIRLNDEGVREYIHHLEKQLNNHEKLVKLVDRGHVIIKLVEGVIEGDDQEDFRKVCTDWLYEAAQARP